MSDVTYTCIDTLQPDAPKVTESAGVITGDAAGYFTTSRPEVAQELKAKYPHMIVTPHEQQTNGRATRAISWTVPDLPGIGWTRKNTPNEGTKADQQAAQHGPPEVK